MKKTLASFAVTILFMISCTKEIVTPVKPPEPEPTTGTLIFWTRASSVKPIEVWVNNSGTVTGTITDYRTTSTPPSCGTSGFVTITMKPGTYIYLAREKNTNPKSWNGNITIVAGVCKTLEFTL